MSETPSSLDMESAELARLEAEAAEAAARAAQAKLAAARLKAQKQKPAPAPTSENGSTAAETRNTPAPQKSAEAATPKAPSQAQASPPAAKPAAAQPKAPQSAPVKPAAAARPANSLAAPPKTATKTAAKAAPGPVVAEEEDLRKFFSRATFFAMGGWSLSMIVHLVVLIVLATWMLPALLKPDPPMIESVQITPEEELTEVLDQQITPSTELSSTSQSFSGLPTGHASTMESSAEPVFDQKVTESLEGPKINIGDVDIAGVSASTMATEVPYGAPGNPQAPVDSYDEAMDRITQEILEMLLKSKVLVVWLFDESESMKDDQREIRTKIERVYTELGLTSAVQGDALLTAVCSYGEKWHEHTRRPTYNLDEIRAAIDRVPTDESGLEMLCQSVGKTVTQYGSYARSGRRQMMLITVTDESGDQDSNRGFLEPAIGIAKAARCRLYFLGREAVFGYPYAQMRWKDKSTDLNYWLQIDRGPETPAVEQLQTNGFYRRYDAHPSGFGPYEQARMARETGGVFFMLPSPEVNLVRRDNRKYALAAMRPYMPDLTERTEYIRERDSKEFRREIYQVIDKLNPYNPVMAPHIVMRHHFSIKPPEFIEQVNRELGKAKAYVIYLDDREKEMASLKPQRDKEINFRWRANYDLIAAQIIAYKVRVYEYGAYLTDFMKNPKPIKNPLGPNKKTTHWDIRHRKETITGELTADYIKQASAMFKQVIVDHPGTPWAARAEYELRRGFGIELMEDYDDPRRGRGVKRPKL